MSNKATHTGKVKFFNATKGWGFIIDDSNNHEFFVHQKALNGIIKEGDRVEFNLEEGKNGKGLTCVNVKKV